MHARCLQPGSLTARGLWPSAVLVLMVNGAMSSETVHVNLGERSYDIVVTSDDPDGLGPFARQRARPTRALLVCDVNTQAHGHAAAQALTQAGFDCEIEMLLSGEAQKCLETAMQLYNRLIELPADRKTLTVAVGGGV